MAYATILVRFVYFITGTAEEESWEGGACITGCLIFFLSIGHCELLYCYHNAYSKWRQGCAHIV